MRHKADTEREKKDSKNEKKQNRARHHSPNKNSAETRLRIDFFSVALLPNLNSNVHSLNKQSFVVADAVAVICEESFSPSRLPEMINGRQALALVQQKDE
jgi:hypothetical protein